MVIEQNGVDHEQAGHHQGSKAEGLRRAVHGCAGEAGHAGGWPGRSGGMPSREEGGRAASLGQGDRAAAAGRHSFLNRISFY